jgi:hypothetical protein
MRNGEHRYLLNLTEIATAKNSVATAKSILSPYFGANSFAFAYAKA